MSEPFVRLSAISRRFDGHSGIEDVSLEISAGESVVVVGPSGSGKTTLLRLIAGLDCPDRGDIWIDTQHVSRAGRNLIPAHERRIGFLFQDLALWPHLSVRKNLDFVLASARLPKSQRAARMDEALQLCRVEPRLNNRFPHQLSGGEQQRVALARALVGAPRLLLLDEPFSSLDRELRSGLRGELLSLHRQLRVTTVSVTHDLEDATELGDRIVAIRAGRVEKITVQRRD